VADFKHAGFSIIDDPPCVSSASCSAVMPTASSRIASSSSGTANSCAQGAFDEVMLVDALKLKGAGDGRSSGNTVGRARTQFISSIVSGSYQDS
jgi:hypothetical protein